MGPSLRVFRGLLGHAVLVKSCAIETSAAAISRILAPIGGNFSPPIGFVARSRNRFTAAFVVASFISTCYRYAFRLDNYERILECWGIEVFVVVCSRDDRLVLNMGQLKVGNPLEAFRRQGS